MIRLLPIMLAAATACGDSEGRPVQLQLIQRGSCTRPDWDFTCLASLQLRMFDETRAYRPQCTSPSVKTWQDLYSIDGPLFVLDEVRARKNVRIELRGYHNVVDGGAIAPCTNLADDRLMLWGTSLPVDLTNPDVNNVNIFVECRPKCDCRFMREGLCTESLERGVCAPPVARKCRDRGCDSGCFDSLLSCVAGICEPPYEDGLCADCAGSSECDSGLCVRHTYDRSNPPVDENFCADAARCPPEGYAYSCPEGMSCTKLGDGHFELLP